MNDKTERPEDEADRLIREIGAKLRDARKAVIKADKSAHLLMAKARIEILCDVLGGME